MVLDSNPPIFSFLNALSVNKKQTQRNYLIHSTLIYFIEPRAKESINPERISNRNITFSPEIVTDLYDNLYIQEIIKII